MLYPLYPPAIEQRFGFIRRARASRLYTGKGARLTDMYQEAGRAILGWGSSRASLAFKNTFNRGAAGGFSGAEARQCVKAVRALLPGTESVAWYTGEAAEQLFREAVHGGETGGGAFHWWRPWDARNGEGGDARERLAFLPPFPLARDVLIVASPEEPPEGVPQAFLPPCLLAALARAVYDLAAELPQRSESGWALYDKVLLKWWRREGPYLYPAIPRGDYPAFQERCLEAGLVISPDYDIPSIVPWEAHTGVFTALGREGAP